MTVQFEYLDAVAIQVAKGELDAAGALSTGERCYVALAANSIEMLAADNYTIAEAIARLGVEWTEELVTRWRYRGNPKYYEGEN